MPLHVHVEAPGALAVLVLTRRCRIGALGSVRYPGEALVVDPIPSVAAVTIVSTTHALAGRPDRMPRGRIELQVQPAASARR